MTTEKKQSPVADLHAKIEGLENENALLKELKAEQDVLLEEAEAKIEDVIISHKGKKLKVTIPRFEDPDNPRVVIKSTDLKDNAKLVEKLVKIKFGGFKELKDK